jgi:hypothetical protein
MESRDGRTPRVPSSPTGTPMAPGFPQTSLGESAQLTIKPPTRRIAADENLKLVLAKLTNLRCQGPREAVCGVEIWALVTVSPVNQSRIAASTRLALAPISR